MDYSNKIKDWASTYLKPKLNFNDTKTKILNNISSYKTINNEEFKNLINDILSNHSLDNIKKYNIILSKQSNLDLVNKFSNDNKEIFSNSIEYEFFKQVYLNFLIENIKNNTNYNLIEEVLFYLFLNNKNLFELDYTDISLEFLYVIKSYILILIFRHNELSIYIYTLIELIIMYKYFSENPSEFLLYGCSFNYYNEIPDKNIYFHILGELHMAPFINIPYNCIYIYNYFELLIEYYLKHTKNNIHIFLESGGQKYLNKSNKIIKLKPRNDFLIDSCDIYYYLNICKRYLNLTDNDNNIVHFKEIIEKYDLNENIISNYIQNFEDRITFHYIDNRILIEKLTKLDGFNEIYKNISDITENLLIFPDKLLEYNYVLKSKYSNEFKNQLKDKLLKCLTPILNEDGKTTIYTTLYNELIDKYPNIFTDLKISELFDKTIDTEYIHFTRIMDEIFILKVLYIHFIQYKENGNYTILFHGGSYHSELYTRFVDNIFKVNLNMIEYSKHLLEIPTQYNYYFQNKITFKKIFNNNNNIYINLCKFEEYKKQDDNIYVKDPIRLQNIIKLTSFSNTNFYKYIIKNSINNVNIIDIIIDISNMYNSKDQIEILFDQCKGINYVYLNLDELSKYKSLITQSEINYGGKTSNDLLLVQDEKNILDLDPYQKEKNILDLDPYQKKKNILDLDPYQKEKNILDLDPYQKKKNILDLDPYQKKKNIYKLNTLDKIELIELSLIFDKINIMESIINVLESGKINIIKTGGKINKWIKFLLF